MKIVDEHTEMNSESWRMSVIPSQSNESLTGNAPIQTVGIETLKNANHVYDLWGVTKNELMCARLRTDIHRHVPQATILAEKA